MWSSDKIFYLLWLTGCHLLLTTDTNSSDESSYTGCDLDVDLWQFLSKTISVVSLKIIWSTIIAKLSHCIWWNLAPGVSLGADLTTWCNEMILLYHYHQVHVKSILKTGRKSNLTNDSQFLLRSDITCLLGTCHQNLICQY